MTEAWCERRIAINSDFEKDSLFTLMEKTNSNILIMGAAGTGKSTLLRSFVEKSCKKCVVLAPTGIAAMNIGGQTIHSFFSLPHGIPTTEDINKERFGPLFKNINTLIVDEISMVRIDIFEAMDLILRNNKNPDKPFGGVQLIMFGDMYQLPPVVTNNDRLGLSPKYLDDSYYFFNSAIFKEFDLCIVHLNQVYRQSDPRFIEILNRMQKNALTSQDLDLLNRRMDTNKDEEDYVVLSTRNDVVEEYNQRKLKLIPSPTFTYEAAIELYSETGAVKIEDTPAVQTLNLKVGARVIILVNDKNKRYCNGSLGTVTELLNDLVNVKLDSDGEIIPINNHIWEIIRNRYDSFSKDIIKEPIGTVAQIPLRLAWAMTIHKSQGQTLDKVMIDLWYRPWESGHSYVAFSRVRSLEGLRLKTHLRKEDILVDPRVIDWENQLKEEKISVTETSRDMTISGIRYDESREVIETLNKELLNDFGISENSLVLWKSQSSFLIKNHPLFFSFIKSRIIFLLNELSKKEKKTIIIDKGKKNEIILEYKLSIKDYAKDLRKKIQARNDPGITFKENEIQKTKAKEMINSPVLVAAGPGTGKTQLILEKTRYLIEIKKVHPKSILISTFTRKATNDLKRRLRENIQEKADDLSICTIHALCKKLLEGIIGELDILSERERYFFVYTHLSELGLNVGTIDFNRLFAFYDTATENDVNPQKLIESVTTDDHKLLAESYLMYLSILEKSNKLDFARLQQKAYHLLKQDSKTLSLWQDRFQYILVDEYQDINPIQDAVIRMLASRKNQITVVGDEDQSIYGFRGASIENFRKFGDHYAHCGKFKLTVNERSSEEIVELSEHIISSTRTFEKHLVSKKGSICAPIIKVYANEREQADAITDWIKQQEQSLGYANITILCRSTKNISEIIDSLKNKGIPYIIYGTQSLSNNEYVKKMEDILLNMKNSEIENKTFVDLFYSVIIRNNMSKELQESDLIAIATFGSLLIDSEKYTSSIRQAIEMINDVPERFIRTGKEITDENSIKIMNIHQAKGLEFPVVMIPDVTNRVYNDRRDIQELIIPIPKELMMNKEEYDSGAENRRIFYVGITRAESGLVLTSIQNEHEQISKYISSKASDTNCKTIGNLGEINLSKKPLIKELTKSSFMAFNRCPFQYYLKCLLSMPKLQKYSLHEGLRLHNQIAKINKLFKTYGIVDISVEQCKVEIGDNEKLNRYFIWAKEHLKEVLGIEFGFEFKDHDTYLKGKIDLLARDKKDEILLVDFKLGKYSPQYHDLELNFYNLLIRKTGQFSIAEQGVYSLSDDTFYKILVDHNPVRQKIFEFSEIYTKKNFYRVKTEDRCSDCHYCKFCYDE